MQNLSDIVLEDTVYCMVNFCEDWHCADRYGGFYIMFFMFMWPPKSTE